MNPPSSEARSHRRLSAIIFDMDGTLVDSTRAVTTAYIDTVRDLGGPGYRPQDVVDAYSLGPPGTILAHLLRRPCSPGDIAAYHRQLVRSAVHVTVYPGIRQALQELARGTVLAVFTGASEAAADIILRNAGLRDFFRVVVGGDGVSRPKPHPEGVLRVCALLDTDVARVAYVGDSPLDLACARSSGALAVAAAWGHLYDRAAPADVVVAEPGQLPARLAGGDAS